MSSEMSSEMALLIPITTWFFLAILTGSAVLALFLTVLIFWFFG